MNTIRMRSTLEREWAQKSAAAHHAAGIEDARAGKALKPERTREAFAAFYLAGYYSEPLVPVVAEHCPRCGRAFYPSINESYVYPGTACQMGDCKNTQAQQSASSAETPRERTAA